jgi:hypothetical protein
VASSAKLVVMPTWNDCDMECWLKKSSDPEPDPECRALGSRWPEAERAIENALRERVRPSRWGKRVTVKHSSAIDYRGQAIVPRSEIPEFGSVVILHVSRTAGWVVMRSREFRSIHCIDVEHHGAEVRLVPRVLHYADL